MKSKKNAPKFFSYKEKSLVRCGNDLYYGNMFDSHVVKLHIKKTKKLSDMNVADKVSIQLMSTDPDLGPRKRIIKSGEKEGLYTALDVAETWLNKALEQTDDAS